jgi:hypothetical protein
MNAPEQIPSPPPGTVGFRCSLLDGVVLGIAALLAWWVRYLGIELWWVVPAVVGHFFLFCNVFRVRQNYELIWSALFLLNFGWWFFHGHIGWLPTMLYQAPITLLAIIAEMLSPAYHGIGVRWINPRRNDAVENLHLPAS